MQILMILLALLTMCACIALMLFAAYRQDRPKAIYFTVMTAALWIYALGHLLELMSKDLSAAITALRLENLGISMIAPFFLMSILSFFRPDALRRWMLPVGLVYGFAMFAAVLFNDQHHLYYTSIQMQTGEWGYAYVKLGYGPLFVVHQVVSMGCIFAMYALLVHRYIWGSKAIRRQMALMLIGSVFAFIANILQFSGVMPNGVDPTPLTMTIASALYSVGIYRYRLLDLVALAASEATEGMDDALVVLNGELLFQYANRSAKRLMPGLKTMVANEQVLQMEDWPEELRGRPVAGEAEFQLESEKGGEKRYFRAAVSPISEDKSRSAGWSFLVRDITESTLMVRKLTELATTDSLTGIWNRRQFRLMVEHHMEVSARLGLEMYLILYDLDFFKGVNDRYGHHAGDHVLRLVADTVKRQLRSYDLFARYGGEEFVIFTTSSEPFDLRGFAERLRLAVARTEVLFEKRKISVTASFGATRIERGMGFDAAMRAVDEVMYQAKTAGRNRVAVAELTEGTVAPVRRKEG